MPTAAGDASSSTSRSAQSSVPENCAADFDAWCAERPGRITVASAMLNTPSGNSISRSA